MNTVSGSRPSNSWSNSSFSIAIGCSFLFHHYGPKHKIPDTPRPIRYIRERFFYGRSFANDNDLNEQAVRWLEGTANVRRHATTGERPVDRFERDERAVLLPLANHPYRRLGARHAPEPAPRRLPATVKVERRPLSIYTEALQ